MSEVQTIVGGGVDARSLSEVFQEVLAALNFLKKRTGAYLVDSGETSTTWYRKYSDGWVEQGGNVNEVGFYAQKNVTYPIPFRDASYSLCVGGKNNPYNNESIVSAIFCTRLSDKSSCTICNYSNPTSTATWFACGYS